MFILPVTVSLYLSLTLLVLFCPVTHTSVLPLPFIPPVDLFVLLNLSYKKGKFFVLFVCLFVCLFLNLHRILKVKVILFLCRRTKSVMGRQISASCSEADYWSAG